MRKLFLPLALSALTLASLSGCANSYPVERIENPVNVTHEVAFGEFRRVFNTAYHVVNRYGVVQTSSYRYGEIRALIGEDTSLFQKTRREIECRIVDAGDYWDVQCRVLIKVEDSEPATFEDQFNPHYEWRTVASDSRLEVRLNNEIRAALSGGAWQAKEPLDPKAREAYAPRKKAKKKGHWKRVKRTKKRRVKKASKTEEGAARPETDEVEGPDESATDEVADYDSPVAAGLPAAAFERIGVSRLGRGDFVQASRAFTAALETSDGDRRASFLVAQAELGQGNYDKALGAVRRGLRMNPAWVKSDLDLRDLYATPEVLEGQFEKLDIAAAREPKLSFLLGFERFHSADPEGALVAFERVLKADPKDTQARTYRDLARAQVDAAHGLEDF